MDLFVQLRPDDVRRGTSPGDHADDRLKKSGMQKPHQNLPELRLLELELQGHLEDMPLHNDAWLAYEELMEGDPPSMKYFVIGGCCSDPYPYGDRNVIAPFFIVQAPSKETAMQKAIAGGLLEKLKAVAQERWNEAIDAEDMNIMTKAMEVPFVE